MFGTSPPSQPFNLPAPGGHYDTFNPYAQPNPPTTPYGGIGFGLGGHGVGPGMSMLGMPMAGMGGANMGSMSLNGRTMGHLGNLGVFAGAGNAPNVSNGNMMMYNPYLMMGQQGGFPGMGPMNAMMGMMGPGQMMSMNGIPGGGPMAQASQDGMKPYDSTQMKRGRNGHYGYLEGRELAGPPVGYMPAGMPPAHPQQQQPPHSANSATATAPAQTAYPPMAYQASATGYPASAAPSAAQRSAWGDPNNIPKARYDGTPASARLVQADLDSPYPRTASGGVASAWTRYGADNEVINGIDGRMGINHRRQREGRV